jgi:hypothetical protein
LVDLFADVLCDWSDVTFCGVVCCGCLLQMPDFKNMVLKLQNNMVTMYTFVQAILSKSSTLKNHAGMGIG